MHSASIWLDSSGRLLAKQLKYVQKVEMLKSQFIFWIYSPARVAVWPPCLAGAFFFSLKNTPLGRRYRGCLAGAFKQKKHNPFQKSTLFVFWGSTIWIMGSICCVFRVFGVPSNQQIQFLETLAW